MSKPNKPKFEKKSQATLYKEAAQLIIDAIKDGTAPWMKPWNAESAKAFMRPHSAISSKNYAGINVVLLMCRNFTDPRWMTFNQAKEKGWSVRKGEKSTPIYFFKPLEIETDETDAKGDKVKRTIPVLKSYAMFNAEQIDGVPAFDAPPKGFEAVDAAEEIIASCGTTFEFGSDDLTYKVATDTVKMPLKASFLDHNYFYATAMHGAALGTAHPSRLNRKTAEFVDDPIVCAQEQMRVEIAAMMLSADLGLAHNPANHVAYVAQWVSILENDPKELFRAARDAEAIRNHLMGFVSLENEADATLPDAPAPEAATAAVDVAQPVVANAEVDSVQAAFDLASTQGSDEILTAPQDNESDRIEPLQDEVETFIFNGNAQEVVSEAVEANAKLDSGLDLGDLDALLGLTPAPATKRSAGMTP